MKDYLKSFFRFIAIVLLVVVLPYWVAMRIASDQWPYEAWLYKEVVTDTSRSFVHNNFEIRFVPDNRFNHEYDEWILYVDGKKTNESCYYSTCDNSTSMIRYIIRHYKQDKKY